MHRAFYSLAGSVNPGHKKEEEKKTIKEVFFFWSEQSRKLVREKLKFLGVEWIGFNCKMKRFVQIRTVAIVLPNIFK